MATFTIARSQSLEGSMSDEDRLLGLFEAHRERLHRLALRLSSSRDEASDLVQETYLRAARRVRSVPRGASREEAWLVRVLVNLCRDQWRRAKVRGREEPIHEGHAVTRRGPEEAAVARATVRAALATLPPRRRAVIVLHELEEKPTEEVARLMGISQVTVRWHLSAARRQLAGLLTKDDDIQRGR